MHMAMQDQLVNMLVAMTDTAVDSTRGVVFRCVLVPVVHIVHMFVLVSRKSHGNGVM